MRMTRAKSPEKAAEEAGSVKPAGEPAGSADAPTPEGKVAGLTPHVQPPLELKPLGREETELEPGRQLRLGSYVFSTDGTNVTATVDSTKVSEAIGGAVLVRLRGVTGFFFKTDEHAGPKGAAGNEGDL